MRTRILPSLLVSLLAVASVHAQSGALDLSFNEAGWVSQGEGENSVFGTAMAVRPNGNIVLVGSISTGFNGTNDQMAYMEVSPDGEVLAFASFGADDRDDFANAVAIQADGKIVLAGSSAPSGDPFATDILLMRIDLDGTLDETFGDAGMVITDLSAPGTPSSEVANAVSILPSGKILVAGTGDELVFEQMLLAQFLEDGDLDEAGFGTNGRIYTTPGSLAFANGMHVLSDGRILAVGYYYDENFVEQPLLARFSSTGTLDGTFGADGFANFNGFSGIAFSLGIQSTGNIVVGNQNAFVSGMELFRVSSEGAFDPTFGFLGVVSTFIFPPIASITPAVVLVQPDDRVVLAGTNEISQFRTLRYSPNGTPDATFGNAGSFTVPATNGAANCAALQQDGKLLLGGFTRNGVGTRSMYVCRLLNDLSVSIAESDEGNDAVLVHPNPVMDEATFTYTLDRSATVSIQLFDAKGAVVRTVLAGAGRTTGTHMEILDLSGLPAGKYILELMTGDRPVRVQLMRI
jgi:uncharacterized delta-60 repeat protein